jgi:hypothetical protein
VSDQNESSSERPTPWYRRKLGALGMVGLGLCFAGSVLVPRLDTPWWPVLMIVVWGVGVLLWLVDLRQQRHPRV